MQNRKINTTDLDFDAIKANLKEFMRGQEEFSDYDFEGSGLSILLDVLSYNTHYNALYTNLAINEVFLDSASKRSSVVSIAKSLGYIPDSAHCSTARVNVNVTNTTSTPSTLNLPKFSPFSTIVDGDSYTFYTMEDYVAIYNGQSYVFENVDIKEGTPLSYKYTVAGGQKYIIPNNDVDLSTLSVRVQPSATSVDFTTFERNEFIIDLDSESKVFFVKEIENEFYEIEFGNGIIGKSLDIGNVVTLNYMVCNKGLPNGAKLFTYQGSSLLGGTVNPITIISAQLGVDKEDIDTIRYNTPRSYATQNRTVNVNDYKSIILEYYPEAESVSVWGGEDNAPPIYGKSFISIKPKTSNSLSSSQKQFVIDTILKPRSVVSITPVIIDPDYIDISIDCTVYYNPRLTNRRENDLKTIVRQAISDFAEENLDSFDGVFRFSKFTSAIDKAEPSIVSNISTITLHREIIPKYNTNAQYKIELGNPIYNGGTCEYSIGSSGFYMLGDSRVLYLEDEPENETTGIMRLYYIDGNLDKQYLPSSIGTVNYKNGSIQLNNLNIIGIDSENMVLIIKAESNDVISVRNQIVRIPDELVNVNIVVDKVASGDAAGNSNYIFTSSRS